MMNMRNEHQRKLTAAERAKVRIEMGKVTRVPAQSKNIGVKLNAMRKPSLPPLPWNDSEAGTGKMDAK
jgi:hypothetical protein